MVVGDGHILGVPADIDDFGLREEVPGQEAEGLVALDQPPPAQGLLAGRDVGRPPQPVHVQEEELLVDVRLLGRLKVQVVQDGPNLSISKVGFLGLVRQGYDRSRREVGREEECIYKAGIYHGVPDTGYGHNRDKGEG